MIFLKNKTSYCVQISLVFKFFFCFYFLPFLKPIKDTILQLVVMSPYFLGLCQSLSLFLMTMSLLKITSQVFCRMSLNLYLNDFFFLNNRRRLQVLEKSIMEVKSALITFYQELPDIYMASTVILTLVIGLRVCLASSLTLNLLFPSYSQASFGLESRSPVYPRECIEKLCFSLSRGECLCMLFWIFCKKYFSLLYLFSILFYQYGLLYIYFIFWNILITLGFFLFWGFFLLKNHFS